MNIFLSIWMNAHAHLFSNLIPESTGYGALEYKLDSEERNEMLVDFLKELEQLTADQEMRHLYEQQSATSFGLCSGTQLVSFTLEFLREQATALLFSQSMLH